MVTKEQNNNNTDLYNQQQGEGILNELNLLRDNHDLCAEQYTLKSRASYPVSARHIKH